MQVCMMTLKATIKVISDVPISRDPATSEHIVVQWPEKCLLFVITFLPWEGEPNVYTETNNIILIWMNEWMNDFYFRQQGP